MTTELPNRHQGPNEAIQSQLNSFGARLRELRLSRGWTLQELACRSALSKAFLSRLESGDRQASIAAVLTLSRIFDVSLGSLFESPPVTEPCVIVRGAETPEKTINGLAYVPLSSAGRFFNLQPLRIRVSPARGGDEHYHHEGEEWVFVLSGRLTLSLAGTLYELEPGDAAHFESRLPHRLIAPGPEDAHVLLVASPVSNPPVSRVNFNRNHAMPGIRLLPFPSDDPFAAVGRRGAQPRIKSTHPKRETH